jgi:4-hydroxy-2-oxoheptanedioate aldolase
VIENSILKKNRQGLRAMGFGMTFPNTFMVEIAGRCGFDFISLDGEHGAFTAQSVEQICRLANGFGMSVTARVPNIDSNTINLFLDRGIQGITGPHVETGEEAQALVDACLFPPEGKRSFGGGRMLLNVTENWWTYPDKLGYYKRWNDNIIVTAQIESKKAWDNLDDILAVKGLTGVTGGPNDFAASLGHPGEPDHPDRVAATADIERRARAAGKTAGGENVGMVAIEVLTRKARELMA